MRDVLNEIGYIAFKTLFTILIVLLVGIVVIISIAAYKTETRLVIILFVIAVDLFVFLVSIWTFSLLWFEL